MIYDSFKPNNNSLGPAKQFEGTMNMEINNRTNREECATRIESLFTQSSRELVGRNGWCLLANHGFSAIRMRGLSGRQIKVFAILF